MPPSIGRTSWAVKRARFVFTFIAVINASVPVPIPVLIPVEILVTVAVILIIGLSTMMLPDTIVFIQVIFQRK